MKSIKTILFLFIFLQILYGYSDHNTGIRTVLQANRKEKSGARIDLALNRALYPSQPTPIGTFFNNFIPIPRVANVENKPNEAKEVELAEINTGLVHYCNTKSGWADFKQLSVKSLNAEVHVDAYMKPLLKFREISNIYVLYLAARRFLKLEGQYCTKGQAKSVSQLYDADTIRKFTTSLCTHAKDESIKYDMHKTFAAVIADYNTNNGADDLNIEVLVSTSPGFCVIFTTDQIQRHGSKIKIKICNFGSITPYSDIDQTVEVFYEQPTNLASFTTKEKFLYFQCAQSEIVRAYDEIFIELFENTSFFIFDLNSYTSGFLEAEAKTANLLQTNCAARGATNNNYYCHNERTYPLNGIISFINHLNGFATQNPNKAAIITNLETIINSVLIKAQTCLGTTTAIGNDILNNLKSEVTTITNSVQNSNLNNFLNSKSPKAKAPNENHQKNCFLRNLGYYDYLTKVNQRFAATNANDIPGLISAAYTSSDTMSEVFHSVYTTNEAYYTAGAIIHVVGGQMGANAYLTKQDLESSFMLNFAMGYEHSIEFMIAYSSAANDLKTYFLFETVSKLAKYIARTKKALTDAYDESCTSTTKKKLIDLFTQNKPVPAVYNEIMSFLEDVKKVKDNKKEKTENNVKVAIKLSNGNQVVEQDNINGQIVVVEGLFNAFCTNRHFTQNQNVDCILSIFKDMSDFVKNSYGTLFY